MQRIFSVHLLVASSTQFNRLELSLGKNMKFFALLMVVGKKFKMIAVLVLQY